MQQYAGMFNTIDPNNMKNFLETDLMVEYMLIHG